MVVFSFGAVVATTSGPTLPAGASKARLKIFLNLQHTISIYKKIRAQAAKTGKYEYLPRPKTDAHSEPSEIYTDD